MAWMSVLITVVVLAAVWRFGADSRDGRDWQPWTLGARGGPPTPTP